MKRTVRRVLSGCFAAVFALSVMMLVSQWLDSRRDAAATNTAQQLAAVTVSEQEAPLAAEPKTEWIPAPVADEDPYVEVLAAMDLTALQQVNPDVVGWILIPGTAIDYPILQTADNQYYLEHSWDGTPNKYGAIFVETMCAADFTGFSTIVYGHNMRNGSMFAALHDFADPQFRAEHPYIYIRTADGVYRYRVFATYLADVESPTYGLSFNQQKTRENFIGHALASSEFVPESYPVTTDRILTLSTCTGRGYESRRVVQAYLEMVQVERS